MNQYKRVTLDDPMGATDISSGKYSVIINGIRYTLSGVTANNMYIIVGRSVAAICTQTVTALNLVIYKEVEHKKPLPDNPGAAIQFREGPTAFLVHTGERGWLLSSELEGGGYWFSTADLQVIADEQGWIELTPTGEWND